VPTNPDDRGRRRATLVATSLGFAVVQLDVSVVNVAIKPIGASLGGGVSALQWVVSAYTLAFAAFILSAGALGDRVGAKRIFVIGFGVFTVASAACGFAPTIGALIAMRVLQGLGAALLVPCSLTLLNHAYPEASQRARAIGLWAAGASTALAAGPLIGGVVTAALGWRAIFFINAPIGLTGILLTLRTATETPRSSQQGLDIPGQLSASIGLAALAAATIEGGSHGFGNVLVIGAYVVAVFMAASFLTIEHRRSSPMLPLGLFRSTTFSSATAVGLLINVAFYGLIFVLSLFFQRGQHLSPLRAGLEFAPMTAAVMAANLLARRPTARLGPWPVIAIGAILMGLGLVALLGTNTGSSFAAMVIQLLAIGFGLGLIVPTMTSALLGSVDPARSGVASGTLNSARQVGSVIGVALYGSFLAHGRLTSGFHLALWVSAGLALAVIAIAWASNGA
jgi:MFS transporter, DHA2 family, methylenomycin A resistance protein